MHPYIQCYPRWNFYNPNRAFYSQISPPDLSTFINPERRTSSLEMKITGPIFVTARATVESGNDITFMVYLDNNVINTKHISSGSEDWIGYNIPIGHTLKWEITNLVSPVPTTARLEIWTS